MGHGLVFHDVLAIVVAYGLGFVITQCHVLGKNVQAASRDVKVDDVLVNDVTDALVADVPLAGVGQVVGLAGHTDFAQVVVQADDDAAFHREIGS